MRQVRSAVAKYLIPYSSQYIFFKNRLDFAGYFGIYNNTTHIIEHI